jgi:hypothetical protein
VVHLAREGFDERVVRADESFCTHAVQQEGTFVVEDATLDPRFVDNPYVLQPNGVRFYAGQPLVAPGGHRVGTLCIADTRPRHFTAEQAALLRDLAQWVQKELVIDSEMERAAQVQAGLLPRDLPDVPGYQVVGACLRLGGHPGRPAGAQPGGRDGQGCRRRDHGRLGARRAARIRSGAGRRALAAVRRGDPARRPVRGGGVRHRVPRRAGPGHR